MPSLPLPALPTRAVLLLQAMSLRWHIISTQSLFCGLDKGIMTGSHHYSIRQCIFTALIHPLCAHWCFRYMSSFSKPTSSLPSMSHLRARWWFPRLPPCFSRCAWYKFTGFPRKRSDRSPHWTLIQFHQVCECGREGGCRLTRPPWSKSQLLLCALRKLNPLCLIFSSEKWEW